MKVVTALVLAMLLGITSQAAATVTGSGSISFSFGSPPDLTQMFPSFSVRDYPGSSTSGSLSGTSGTVTNGHSTASVSGVTTMVSGSIPSEWPGFSFTANAPSEGAMGFAEAGIQGYHLYGGPWYGADITTLPALSYTYTFAGHVDSPGDTLRLGAQFEVGYELWTGGYNDYGYRTYGSKVTLYSDYDPSVAGFQSKMPWFTTPDASGNISATGTVDFGPFTAPAEARWFVRWDVGGGAGDAWSDNVTAVPEPSILLLVGSGFVGIVALRRRFRK